MSKGESTKTAIVQRATELATTIGLESLSIGMLADELSLSKSGLFAHFKSKESLQVAVVEHASARFTDVVVRPTLATPRGLPRVEAGFEHWRSWPERTGYPGGCFFLAAASEFDDRPGIVRQAIADQMGAWLDTLAVIVRGAITEGHFSPDVDPSQFVFDLYGIIASYHHHGRLLGRPDALRRARASFASLVARSRASDAPSLVATSTLPAKKRAARRAAS